MASSWESTGPKSKIVDSHQHIGYYYGFVAALFALAFLVTFTSERSYPVLGAAIVCAALALVHFKVSDAAENDKPWVAGASSLLSLPLLVAFPIGTFFGVKLLINTAKLKHAGT
jgi:hypothetical protein